MPSGSCRTKLISQAGAPGLQEVNEALVGRDAQTAYSIVDVEGSRWRRAPVDATISAYSQYASRRKLPSVAAIACTTIPPAYRLTIRANEHTTNRVALNR